MANKTPFQLTAMAGTDLATDDVLLIGDLSATGTKQIDLSEAFATQAIAEAGTNETRFMNPLRVAQAIDALAPKTTYNVQAFTASGTWTAPSDAQTGDKVYVFGVGGGGSGSCDSIATESNGGSGGFGGMYRFDDIDDLSSSETVVVGAGGASLVSANGNGNNGGASSFGTSGAFGYVAFGGGPGGKNNDATQTVASMTVYSAANSGNISSTFGIEGRGGSDDSTANRDGEGARYGGGGGGGGPDNNGGVSLVGGHGGKAASTNGEDGEWPGGGGGASDATSGAGADGLIVVYCVREA